MIKHVLDWLNEFHMLWLYIQIHQNERFQVTHPGLWLDSEGSPSATETRPARLWARASTSATSVPGILLSAFTLYWIWSGCLSECLVDACYWKIPKILQKWSILRAILGFRLSRLKTSFHGLFTLIHGYFTVASRLKKSRFMPFRITYFWIDAESEQQFGTPW